MPFYFIYPLSIKNKIKRKNNKIRMIKIKIIPIVIPK